MSHSRTRWRRASSRGNRPNVTKLAGVLPDDVENDAERDRTVLVAPAAARGLVADVGSNSQNAWTKGRAFGGAVRGPIRRRGTCEPRGADRSVRLARLPCPVRRCLRTGRREGGQRRGRHRCGGWCRGRSCRLRHQCLPQLAGCGGSPSTRRTGRRAARRPRGLSPGGPGASAAARPVALRRSRCRSRCRLRCRRRQRSARSVPPTARPPSLRRGAPGDGPVAAALHLHLHAALVHAAIQGDGPLQRHRDHA